MESSAISTKTDAGGQGNLGAVCTGTEGSVGCRVVGRGHFGYVQPHSSRIGRKVLLGLSSAAKSVAAADELKVTSISVAVQLIAMAARFPLSACTSLTTSDSWWKWVWCLKSRDRTAQSASTKQVS